MIQDVLNIFKKFYNKHGDKIILDNYELKDGLYVKLDDAGEYESYQVKKIKNRLELYDKNGNLNYLMQEWFRQRDYYSSYLNSNNTI